MAALAIVPAAGKGARFTASSGTGVGAKLMASVVGEPLLDHTLRALLDGGAARVVVVLPPGSRAPYAASRVLADARVLVAVNPDPSRGMLSSIQIGFGVTEGDPVVILPGDMPFVRASTVAAVIDACRESGRIVSPRYDGRRGHPIGLPGRLRGDILAAGAEATLSTLLAGLDRRDLDVDDPGILRDVDVAGDLAQPGS